jgi:uncharacterized protein (TIGR03382 family)
MPDAIYYGGLPWNTAGACIHQHCPKKEAHKLRRRLYQLDPNSDWKLTKAEVKAKYPCVKWKKLYKLYSTFYWRWRFWNAHCQYYNSSPIIKKLPRSLQNLPPPDCDPCYRPNSYSGSAKAVINYLKCIKKPARKVTTGKRRAKKKPRRKWQPIPKKDPILDKPPVSELSRIRDQIKKEGIKGDGRKHEPTLDSNVGIGHLDEGCNCNNLGGAAIVAGVLLLLWLLFRRKKDGGDDKSKGNGDTATPPATPPPLPIGKLFGPTKMPTPAPSQPSDAVMEVGSGEDVDTPPPLPELPKLSQQMNSNYMGQFKLEKEDLGVEVSFSRDGIEYIASAEGLDSPHDALPLAYYWMQNKLAANQQMNVTSTVFSIFAYHHGGAGGEYTDDQLALGYLHWELSHLANKICHQLDFGFPLFHVEKITAHIGAYFHLNAGKAVAGHGKEWYALREDEMRSALEAFASGNYAEAVSGMEGAFAACASVSEGPQDELGVVAGLIGMNLSELFYRVAAGEMDVTRRRAFLEGAVQRAKHAKEAFSNHKPYRKGEEYKLDSAFYHARKLERLSTEAVSACGTVGACIPVGVTVPDYGPTASSLVKSGDVLKLSYLMPIRSVWK